MLKNLARSSNGWVSSIASSSTRSLSWLQFNERVLEEAMDETHPLLERAKFLSIFHSNLDEFFMIRVSGLREQADSGILEQGPEILTAGEQLAILRERVLELNSCSRRVFAEDLLPKPVRSGLNILY